ncbi:MAG: uracil-DNA glycosylase family protein [Blastocatellales bacterium]
MSATRLENLLTEIRACQVCAGHLPHAPRPVLSAGKGSRLLIIGQAPGRRVHESGIPWQDQSGDTLRDWLQMTKEQFYDERLVAIVPAGFCYPGKGVSGDLPPRPECAPLWHPRLLAALKKVELTLLIGNYAQTHYLKNNMKRTLTETVASFAEYLPSYFPLPHPSPRNRNWLRRNAWFATELLPVLRRKVAYVLAR